MSYTKKLRLKSEAGALARARAEAREKRLENKEEKAADLEEATERIKEAEGPKGKIARAAQNGEREAVVCVLRGGIHFSRKFEENHSPKFLGRIGRIIRHHFLAKGLKVSFRYWDDPCRCNELECDSGYQLIVSW